MLLPNLLIASPLFPPMRGGGAEHSLEELCNCFANKKWKVKVCALGDYTFSHTEFRPSGYDVEWLVVPEYGLDDINNYINGKHFYRGMVNRLRLIASTNKPDIIIANNAQCYKAVSVMSRILSIPSIAIVRDPQPICPVGHCIEEQSSNTAIPCSGYLGIVACYVQFLRDRHRFPIRAIPGIIRDALIIGYRRVEQQRALRNMNTVVTISDALGTLLRASDEMKHLSTITIPNLHTHVEPSSNKLVSEFMNRYDLHSGAFFLFAGKKTRGKGADLLQPAMDIVGTHFQNIKLLAIGPGNLINNNNYVIDGPFVERSMLLALLSRATALVIPGRVQEGLHRTMIDAVRLGIPVICSDCGGVKEGIQNNKNGYVVRSGQVDALADSMTMVQSWDNNRQLECKIVSKNIFKTKFADDIIISKWSDLFSSLINA